MSLDSLDRDELKIVHVCMKCIADGEIIQHDWEFQTIMGVHIAEYLEVFDDWPNLNESKEAVRLSINNCMANLVGYPHKAHHRWSHYFDISREDIIRVLSKWKGEELSSCLDALE